MKKKQSFIHFNRAMITVSSVASYALWDTVTVDSRKKHGNHA